MTNQDGGRSSGLALIKVVHVIDDDFFDESEITDTQVRKNYEKAVGAFLVAFNRLENEIAEVIVMALERSGRPDLANKCVQANFAAKLHYLDLLSISPKAAVLASAPYDEMKRIGSRRNEIAHGHFRQNDYDESYIISSSNGVKKTYISIEKVNEETDACSVLTSKISIMKVHFWFDDIAE